MRIAVLLLLALLASDAEAARRKSKGHLKDQAQHKQDMIAVKAPKDQARQDPAPPDAGWEHIYQIRERRDGTR